MARLHPSGTSNAITLTNGRGQIRREPWAEVWHSGVGFSWVSRRSNTDRESRLLDRVRPVMAEYSLEQ